jgi:nucleoside-diphosphate-sugar epimerase
MKNILVTGGCGFIGSHLLLFLKRKKFKVIVIDNLKAFKILKWKPKIKIQSSIKNMIKWEEYLIKNSL